MYLRLIWPLNVQKVAFYEKKLLFFYEKVVVLTKTVFINLIVDVILYEYLCITWQATVRV